jgi:hypothetical protein
MTMSKNEWKNLVSVAGRMLLALVFVFSQTAWAGQNEQTKDKPASPQKANAQQAGEKLSSPAATAKAQSSQAQGEESESSVAEGKPGDPSHQGIKVHGHWTIEVRNPDGTLIRHVEFENSLSAGQGNVILSQILARRATVSHWQIVLLPLIGAGPCLDSGGNPISCIIAEPEPNGACPSSNSGLTCPASNVFPTLNTPTLDGNSNLVLSGQATAAMNSNVGTVGTSLHICNPTISPNAAPCPGTTGQSIVGFTEAIATTGPGIPTSPTFNSPIPVSPGQVIAVTVVISFS